MIFPLKMKSGPQIADFDKLGGYDIITSLEYSYGLVKKCFPKIWDISKCHSFPISYPIFIIFVTFCVAIFFLTWKMSNYARMLLFCVPIHVNTVTLLK